MTSIANQTVALINNCLKSIEIAGDSCPHLYDEAEGLCVDLLVELRRMRRERDQAKEVKQRGMLMERDAAMDQRPTLEEGHTAPESDEL
jgi:hypothetical protein